jgi:hypothetical protein
VLERGTALTSRRRIGGRMPDRMAHRHGCASTTSRRRLKPSFRRRPGSRRDALALPIDGCQYPCRGHAAICASLESRTVHCTRRSLILFQHRPDDGHYVNQYGCPFVLTGYALRIIGPRTLLDQGTLSGFGSYEGCRLGRGTGGTDTVDGLTLCPFFDFDGWLAIPR